LSASVARGSHAGELNFTYTHRCHVQYQTCRSYNAESAHSCLADCETSSWKVRLRLFQSRFIADPPASRDFVWTNQAIVSAASSSLEARQASKQHTTTLHLHAISERKTGCYSSFFCFINPLKLIWMLFQTPAMSACTKHPGQPVLECSPCLPAPSRPSSSATFTLFRSLLALFLSFVYRRCSFHFPSYPFEDRGNAGVCTFIPSSYTRDTPTKSKRVAIVHTFGKQQF
jgi:hypothetical protein